MSENKNPKKEDQTAGQTNEAKNEAKQLIDSLKLDAQPTEPDNISDLSDVISNLQLDLPTEESLTSESQIDLNLNIEPEEPTQEQANIDETLLTPQQKETENNEIQLDLSLELPETNESKEEDIPKDTPTEIPTNSSDKETISPIAPEHNQTSKDTASPAKQEEFSSQHIDALSNEKQSLSEKSSNTQPSLPSQNETSLEDITAEKPSDKIQSSIPDESNFENNKSTTDPFEKESQKTDPPTDQIQDPKAIEDKSSNLTEQQLNSLESLIEEDNTRASSPTEDEIPTSLEETYNEEAPPPKKKFPKGILIGIGSFIILIGGAIVFMASMPDVFSNLLNAQKDTQPTITQSPNAAHPLQTQTGENAVVTGEERIQNNNQNTPEKDTENEETYKTKTLTIDDLQSRLDDIKQLMDEVEFNSTKDKIRAKVLQKKISALIEQGDLQKADNLLTQLEDLIYGN